jgi:hypothetical protein
MKSFQVYANASYYGGTLIRHQEWCDNGFLRSDEYVDYMKYYSHTTYYCNGEKQFVGNFRSGMNWDTATWYYPNGQNKMQKYFTPYPEDGKTEHNPWEESHARYWKENGDTLPWEYNTDGFNLPPGAGIPYGQTPAGTIDYYRVKSKWYQNNMQVFRDSVYKLIKLPDSCYCKYGTISIGFFVEEDGLISDIRIDHDVDPAIAHAFKDAIAQIRYWPKANTEGVPTRISVYMSMSLENVPRK